MTEEIKEILEELKSDSYIRPYQDFYSEYPIKIIDKKQTKLLLNYITNLQKENDWYKKEHEKLNNALNGKITDFKFKELDKAQEKIEKASDFILSKAKEYKPHFAKIELNTADCNELLNILKGGDE